MKPLTKFFLNERNVSLIISLNVFVVLLQSFVDVPWLNVLELFFTFAFFLEIIVKMMARKKHFFKDIWDTFDFGLCSLLVMITILVMTDGWDTRNFMILGFRVIRILRVLRLVRFFKRVGINVNSILLGLKANIVLLPLLLLVIFLFSMLSTVMFQNMSPTYFGNPLRAFISTLHIFTVEGWNEIPEAVVGTSESVWYYLVQLYFIIQVVIGGLIILPTFLGSINDAMAQDDNKEQLAEIKELKKLISEQSDQISQQGKMIEKLCNERSNGENP